MISKSIKVTKTMHKIKGLGSVCLIQNADNAKDDIVLSAIHKDELGLIEQKGIQPFLS